MNIFAFFRLFPYSFLLNVFLLANPTKIICLSVPRLGLLDQHSKKQDWRRILGATVNVFFFVCIILELPRSISFSLEKISE